MNPSPQSSLSPVLAARIAAIEPHSPADDAGFTVSCLITSVDGHPLHDIIDWRWFSSEEAIDVSYIDETGDLGTVHLERDPGEDWGFSFTDALFDKVKLCRNACTFCFMRQLPEEARDSLVLRDDDFRLSFLQGTFVTLTNLGAEDEARIIEQHISPLRFSLHASSPEVRASLIGKHAAHGLAACERLLEAGVEMHAQIVLVPEVNDAEELALTLAWAYDRPGILSVGIVPIGFTKHQSTFSKSFNKSVDARAVIAALKPFQRRAQQQRGCAWVYAADEFYRNAYPENLLEHLPPLSHYGDFDMFEDGIGIIRSFVDDWQRSTALIDESAALLCAADARIYFVIGYAQREFFLPLVAASPLAGRLIPFPVKNEYFGGNVDVTGLLCGCDIAAALAAAPEIERVVIPEVVFNDDGVTLDNMTLEDIIRSAAVGISVVSCNPSEFLKDVNSLMRE
ncbi:MAG: DUF512 domain-containing protein [Eggerthellaceae bacterium]